MFRLILIFIGAINYSLIESVTIEYDPSSKFIMQRVRTDVNSIDPILRSYITPHEIQFDINAVDNGLKYFLKCKGSKNSIGFTVPTGALKHLALDTDHKTHTITATLRRNQLTSDLVGRYNCSEIVHNKFQETIVHVFIQDGRTVFTKTLYPTIYKQTGIHFFNLPCQTTSWFPRISCPSPPNLRQCKVRSCNSQEQKVDELKCNIPQCPGQELCIPVYFNPSNLKAEKVLFDPQIGFALENPNVLNGLSHFTCMSNYTPSQESKIPFDSSEADYVQIHQPSLTVTSKESLTLSCEIQYGTKAAQKSPGIFWFEDIHKLQLLSNQTDPQAHYNAQTKVYHRNTSITLQGFKPNKIYRFYCVRVSDQGLYSRSVDITCANAPSLDLDINQSGTESDSKIQYGSDASYDISILTIPRSSIILDISRNGQSLKDDKRFELLPITNQENQFLEYTLTIYNITFEDELDLKITAKSSTSEKSSIIKPTIVGNPVGELSFIPEQIPRSIPWRSENSKNKINIFAYGILPRELYRIVCTIRHHSNDRQPLDVFIQYSTCSIDNCVSNLNDKICRTSSSPTEQLLAATSNKINKFETQFVSVQYHKLDDPSAGHQYLCCYKQQGLVSIAKAITILSNNRNMFSTNKPEFGLVRGDILTYRCEGHELIYDDLLMIYNNNAVTYERHSLDNQWRVKGSRQTERIDITWNLPTSENIRSTAIEVKTPALGMIGSNGFFECVGLSKRSDIIPNMNDKYVINVEDAIPLEFKNQMPVVSRLDKKSGDNVQFDCQFTGRPKPKLVWLKGKLPLNEIDSPFQFGANNGSIFITRAQASDTGYYTCELNNGRNAPLRRSFDLRVKGTNPYSRLGPITAIVVIASILILILMLISLTIFAIKYFKMKKNVHDSIFHENQSGIAQLTDMRLPDNFASQHQIRTFLSYVNGDNLPVDRNDFKELGRGQFGVVYQVRLPDVGLVAAKVLPETIRNSGRRRDKRKKSIDVEENEEMLTKQETRMKKAAEMLIDEIKVMHQAGKHVNIVGLKKVAYPETKVRFLFTGGPIRDEDSFYLMELCSNGSLESMLKRFIQQSTDKPSLYQTLSKPGASGMTVTEAYEQCSLTDDDLKLIAYQVAWGVDYLNRKQIAHCDIAARNVLVTSRFIMKICDFGLATWTTYKNYREQLAQNDSVHLEKKNTEIATHNLTPQLARAFLRSSNPDERLLLNQSSIKSDVWSFGIFLWTLFLKCRIRPFNKLLEEMEKNKIDGESFFQRLARVISDGDVLQYIHYDPKIPRDIYAIIRECLVEENRRPEMTRIRAYLCHSNMLSTRAFEYYRSEYNQYQEDNATDGNIERLPEVQGVSDLPQFDGENPTDDRNSRRDDNVAFRPPANDNMDYPEQYQDSYIAPTNNASKTGSNLPQVHIKNPAPDKPPIPPRRSKRDDDPYL